MSRATTIEVWKHFYCSWKYNVVHTATTMLLRYETVNIFAENENENIQHRINVCYHDKNRQAHRATHESRILIKSSFLSRKFLSKLSEISLRISSVTFLLSINSSATAAAFSHFLFIFVFYFFHSAYRVGCTFQQRIYILQFFAGIQSDKTDGYVTRVSI